LNEPKRITRQVQKRRVPNFKKINPLGGLAVEGKVLQKDKFVCVHATKA